jgi:hypothetical protein
MRLLAAIQLKFIVRQKADQMIGMENGIGAINQASPLYGDTLNRTRVESAFAEKANIKDTKERRNPLFLLI